MAEDSEIQREEQAGGGRYVARFDAGEAEMTFRSEPGRMVIDHTYVPDALRGGGIGERLVRRAVHDARASGTKIVPRCPFVAALFRRHPDFADVRAR
jgi:predicted GNAT family acetyltransferase